MSYYDDDRYDDRRRHKSRRDDPPRYEEEEIIAARRKPKGSGSGRDKAVIPRRDSSDSSVEEVRREFPPYGSRGDYKPRRAKSARDSRRGGRYDDGYYDEYDDRKHRSSKRDKRRRDSTTSSSSRSPPPKDRRRKSLGEQALGALGVGGAGGAALAAALGGGQRSKSQDRGEKSRRKRHSRRYSDSSTSSSSRSRSRGRNKPADLNEMLIKAAKAAALAGGTEAWRMRKEPGDWKGAKGKRVLTAAAGAAGVNGLLGGGDKGSSGNTIQSVIGGLAGNRLLNGSRNEERSRSHSRGRDRSESKGGLGGLASIGGATALASAAAKAFNNRSKSRGRRDYSSSSDDSRYRSKKSGRRSKSVSDYMRQGMAKIGIGSNEDKRDITSRGSSRDARTDTKNLPRAITTGGTVGAGTGQRGLFSRSSSSSSDDISSSEEERERKKMGRKQLITAGLASVATIHAAHNIYGTMHMQTKLDQDVAEGEISPEMAKKKRNKARLRRAAAVGVAALGVKGAYSEWKEMKEQRDEAVEFKHKMERRRERKLMKAHPHDVTPETGSIHSSDYVPNSYHGRPSDPSVPYQGVHGEYRDSAPDLASHPNAGYSDYDGLHYYDHDNPYHTAPPQMAAPAYRP